MADEVKELGENFHRAWPLGGDYVTRTELAIALDHAENRLQAAQIELGLKIKNSEMSQRNWILTGVIAIMLVYGGGYLSLVMKLDRLSEAFSPVTQTLAERKIWMDRQEYRNERQDRSLEGLDPAYKSLPYTQQPR